MSLTLCSTAARPGRLMRLTRDVIRAECRWLPRDLAAGTIVARFTGATYGCITSNGTAVSFDETRIPRSANRRARSARPERSSMTAETKPEQFGHTHYYGTEYAHFDGHQIEFSAYGSSGYCYSHQSFACIDQVTQGRIDEAFAGPLLDDWYVSGQSQRCRCCGDDTPAEERTMCAGCISGGCHPNQHCERVYP